MNYKTKYGRQWPEEFEDWQIELKMYQHPEWSTTNSLPSWKHFIKAAQLLWGPNNTKQQFLWHPWAVDMIKGCTQAQEVGLCGPGSCGKSQFMAVWTILNWLVDPAHTLIFVTSTTIPRAQQKIWGAVESYYTALPDHVRSAGSIVNTPTPVIWTEANGARIKTAGIHLVAAAQSQARESIGKLQGSKANSHPQHRNGRLLLIMDELSDLSHAVLAAIENLKSNDYFHALAAANPRSKYDPFSLFVEPKGGYETISVESSSWETTRGGLCLHFDDMKNPNYIERENKWPIKKWEIINETIENGDLNSPEFWRNFRGYWCPFGADVTIYTDEDIKSAHADQKFTNWRLSKEKIRVMGVDSAFSSGGDRTIAMIGELGYDSQRLTQVVNILATEEITINAGDKTKSPSQQVSEKIIEVARKYEVTADNVGFDATVSSAADNLAMVWQRNDFYRVDFRGAATSLTISDLDSTPANEKYGNRVTELWFFGKELLRHRQLYGIHDDLAMELVVRKYSTSKAGTVSKLMAEPKKDMRKRTGGRSPDMADAMCIMLDLCRQKHGLRTPVTKLDNDPRTKSGGNWLSYVKKKNSARSGGRLNHNA
jgi:hypothetical protein